MTDLTKLTAQEVLARAKRVTVDARIEAGLEELQVKSEYDSEPASFDHRLCFVQNKDTGKIRVFVALDAYAAAWEMSQSSGSEMIVLGVMSGDIVTESKVREALVKYGPGEWYGPGVITLVKKLLN